MRSGESNYQRLTHAVVSQIFRPTTRDLRRLVEKNWDSIIGSAIPASDRTVRLDHNSEPYRVTISTVIEVQNAVETTNLFEDEEDRAQRIAELSAGHTLIRAPRVSVEACRSVLVRCLKYLVKQFRDTTVGAVATIALKAVCALFGITLPS